MANICPDLNQQLITFCIVVIQYLIFEWTRVQNGMGIVQVQNGMGIVQWCMCSIMQWVHILWIIFSFIHMHTALMCVSVVHSSCLSTTTKQPPVSTHFPVALGMSICIRIHLNVPARLYLSVNLISTLYMHLYLPWLLIWYPLT